MTPYFNLLWTCNNFIYNFFYDFFEHEFISLESKVWKLLNSLTDQIFRNNLISSTSVLRELADPIFYRWVELRFSATTCLFYLARRTTELCSVGCFFGRVSVKHYWYFIFIKILITLCKWNPDGRANKSVIFRLVSKNIGLDCAFKPRCKFVFTQKCLQSL